MELLHLFPLSEMNWSQRYEYTNKQTFNQIMWAVCKYDRDLAHFAYYSKLFCYQWMKCDSNHNDHNFRLIKNNNDKTVAFHFHQAQVLFWALSTWTTLPSKILPNRIYTQQHVRINNEDISWHHGYNDISPCIPIFRFHLECQRYLESACTHLDN